MVIQPPVADPTQTYRREARRLRWHYADRPLELYNSLRQLSAQHDQQYVASEDLLAASVTKSGQTTRGSRQFAQMVASQIESGLLNFSDRQRLLSLAETMGIGRFQANLIIAAVQHQTGAPISDLAPSPVKQFRWIGAVAAVLAVQGLIVACVYAVFLSS